VSREHKSAVRAWAASPANWDFATGDDRGMVGLWEEKAMKPRLFAGATGAVTQLAYSPYGSHLAVGDASGAVRVWNLGAERAVAKITRVGAQVAFGPTDDTVVLSDGKRLELWSLGELAKQP
jgi:WD40 repeat protein